jgi:hypothetical protein
MNGDTCVEMEPGGINDPSMAIFRNITFSNREYFFFVFLQFTFLFFLT